MLFLVPIIPMSQNPEYSYYILNLLMVLLISIELFTVFGFDDEIKWDTYLKGTPLSATEIVVGRYVLCGILNFICMLVEVVILIIMNIWKNSVPLKEVIVILFWCLVIGVLYAAVMIPVIYKFGVVSSKYILYAILLLPTFLLPLLIKAGVNINISKMMSLSISNLFILFGLILITILSIKITIIIYKNKEF